MSLIAHGLWILKVIIFQFVKISERKNQSPCVYGFVLECMATGFARPPFDSMSLLSMQSFWLSSQYKIIYRWCNCLFNQVVFIYFLYDSDEQLIAHEPYPAREIFYFNSRCPNLIDGKNKKYWVIKRVVPHYFDI